MPSKLPPEIRKACMLLGVRVDELTLASVLKAWKQQITAPGVHPEQGGDRESAIYINSAKDTLVRWLEGYPGGAGPDSFDPRLPSGNPRKPKPDGGSNIIAFPTQE
jgi:hypothetical protein